MVASGGWETSLQVAYRRDTQRKTADWLSWLIYIYDVALMKNDTVLGPFQDMDMTTPSFPRVFL